MFPAERDPEPDRGEAACDKQDLNELSTLYLLGRGSVEQVSGARFESFATYSENLCISNTAQKQKAERLKL